MNFDLKIENYSRGELIEMFELPNDFDKNIVEIKENHLRNSILNNTEINKETKQQTLNFIIKAKSIIINGIQNKKNDHVVNLAKGINNLYNSSYKLKPSKLEEDTEEHMLQIRPEKQYLSSYPSDFFPGIINPLKKRTIKKNLNIDTRFRDNYYTSASTNFNLNLPMNFKNVVQMQLGAIEIPKANYLISKQYGNNFFSISANGSSQVITIPNGNYDQNTIISAVNYQLSLLSAPFNEITFVANVTTNGITGSAQTLVGFNNLSGNTSLELNFQVDKYGNEDRNIPLPLKFGWILGFRNGVYVNNLNYVSEGLINTNSSSYFFLVIDDHNNNVNNSFYSAFNSSILNKNIIARISTQIGSSYSLLEQNNLSVITTPREYFGPVDIEIINIQLLDEYGRIVDLNNMDFSFCLTLTTSYDI
jgi:hypothetical protein